MLSIYILLIAEGVKLHCPQSAHKECIRASSKTTTPQHTNTQYVINLTIYINHPHLITLYLQRIYAAF